MFERILEKVGLAKFVSARTFQSISTLMFGTVLSAVIPILASPVMTRIFSTADYGILGLYMGISGLLGVLAYAHYSQAILLAKEHEIARQALWLTLGFSMAVALVTLLVLILLLSFSSFISHSSLGGWYFFIPASVFLNGASASLMVWANRHQSYKALASNRILQAVITVVLQISIGLWINDESGLMVGLIAGQVLSVLLLLLSFKKIPQASVGKPSSQSFYGIARQYKSLLFYSTPSEFINNLINQTPIFLLQRFGGLSYVGSYNFTQRFLGLPQQFLSTAIVEVFKQKATHSYNESGNCELVFMKTLKTLTLLASVPFLVVVFFAPPLFAFVFGPEWREAGVFAQFLSVLFFFRFIVSPLTYVYIIAGKLREDFWLHILFLVVTTLAFFVGDLFLTEKKYLLLVYSLSYSSIYLIYFFRSYKFSKRKI